MKKILMNFSENVLSRSQMRTVKGGYEENGPPACTWCKTDARFLCSKKIDGSGDCECLRTEDKECQSVIV